MSRHCILNPETFRSPGLLSLFTVAATLLSSACATPAAPKPEAADAPQASISWELGPGAVIDEDDAVGITMGCLRAQAWAIAHVEVGAHQRWALEHDATVECSGDAALFVVAERRDDRASFRLLLSLIYEGDHEGPIPIDTTSLEDNEVLALRFMLLQGGLQCGHLDVRGLTLRPLFDQSELHSLVSEKSTMFIPTRASDSPPSTVMH